MLFYRNTGKGHSKGDKTMNMPYNPGWQCPVCGKGVNPTSETCPCNGTLGTTITTTTSTCTCGSIKPANSGGVCPDCGLLRYITVYGSSTAQSPSRDRCTCGSTTTPDINGNCPECNKNVYIGGLTPEAS